MWSNLNLGGLVETALEKANTLKENIESQLDDAVGNATDESKNSIDHISEPDPHQIPQPPSLDRGGPSEDMAPTSPPKPPTQLVRQGSSDSASSRHSSRSPPPPLDRKHFETVALDSRQASDLGYSCSDAEEHEDPESAKSTPLDGASSQPVKFPDQGGVEDLKSETSQPPIQEDIAEPTPTAPNKYPLEPTTPTWASKSESEHDDIQRAQQEEGSPKQILLSSRPQIIMQKSEDACESYPSTPGYVVPQTRTPRQPSMTYFPPEDPSKFPISSPQTPRTDDLMWTENSAGNMDEQKESSEVITPRSYAQVIIDKQNNINDEEISYSVTSSNVNTYAHDIAEPTPTASNKYPLEPTTPTWASKSEDDSLHQAEKEDTSVVAKFRESMRLKELAFEEERTKMEARLHDALAALQTSEHTREQIQEALTQRERQLETTSHELAAVNEQLVGAVQAKEDADAEVVRLKGILQDEIKARASMGEEAAKVAELQTELKERDEKISGLLEEGKKLSQRQGEVEQAMRKARADFKTADADKQRAIKEKVGLQERIEELIEQLKHQNDEKANQSQSIAAMHAVSQASSDKLAKVEAEKDAALQEIVDKTQALEKAWSQMDDLKKQMAEMKAEKDDLSSRLQDQQLSEEVSKKDRREWLDREQRLQASLEQLEASLARHQTEAEHREEGLRREAESLRQRWLDAVARSEAIASGVQEAGAPLLRQIKGLQEESRARATAWAATEASLSERTSTAEANARSAEAAKASAEARFTQANKELSENMAELEELKNEVVVLKADFKKAEKKAEKAQERIVELEGELTGTKEVYNRALKEAKGTEAKLKLQVSAYRDQLEVVKLELDDAVNSSQSTVSKLQGELERERKLKSLELRRSSSQGPVTQGGFLAQSLEGSDGSESSATTNPADAAAGNTSLVAVQHLQRSLRQKEGEVMHLQAQMQVFEQTRSALAEEVNHLSQDNTRLQRQNTECKVLKRKHADLEAKYEVLLDLLGEKSEELDGLQQDMEALKATYKAQIEQLVPQNTQKG